MMLGRGWRRTLEQQLARTEQLLEKGRALGEHRIVPTI